MLTNIFTIVSAILRRQKMFNNIKLIGVGSLVIFAILMMTVAANFVPHYSFIIFIGGGVFLLIAIVTIGISGRDHGKEE